MLKTYHGSGSFINSYGPKALNPTQEMEVLRILKALSQPNETVTAENKQSSYDQAIPCHYILNVGN